MTYVCHQRSETFNSPVGGYPLGVESDKADVTTVTVMTSW